MTLTGFYTLAGRFESCLFENPEDRFSRDKAQFKLSQFLGYDIANKEVNLLAFLAHLSQRLIGELLV